MSRYQQKAFPRLTQSSEFPTVVLALHCRISIAIEQCNHLIEQVPSSGLDARDVFQQEELRWIITECFQHQPKAPEGKPVQCLVFRGEAQFLREQARKSLARRAEKNDVGIAVASRSPDVGRSCFFPLRWRFMPMKRYVLRPIKCVEQGGRDTHISCEITHA